MTLQEFQRHLKRLEKEFNKLYEEVAPRVAGTTAVKLFKENFQNEGFFGTGWKNVKRRESVSKSKAHYAWSRRKILTGETGDLGRSIKFELQNKGTVLVFTDPSEFVSSKEPYGRVHNEGLRAGRGKGFIMPKRQFIGDHPKLREAIVKEIEKKLRELKVKS